MKIKLAVFCFLCLSYVNCVFGQVNLQNGLVSSYDFSGNANDGIGTNNGSLVNGVTQTTDRNGVSNGAYLFDGADDYIKITAAQNINNANLTYSFWVSMTSQPTSGTGFCIFEFGSGGTGTTYGQLLGINNNYGGHTGWTFNSGNTDGTIFLTSNGSVPIANQWFNVVVSRNNTDISTYVDGVLLTSTSVAGKTAFYNGTTIDLYIGSRKGGAFQNFQGKIDDVCLYNRAFTQQEVSALYNFASGNNSQNLSLTTTNSTIVIGSSTTLTASGANSYTWSPSAGLSSTTGLAVTANPTVTTTYSVLGDFNSCSCHSTAPCSANKSITIVVDQSASLSVFEPSRSFKISNIVGDFANNGSMSYFEIKCDDLKELNVSIFDRMGRIVHTMDAPNAYWDGQNSPSGVYYYIVTKAIDKDGRDYSEKNVLPKGFPSGKILLKRSE